MFQRSLNPPKSHSFFLLGARATGKTTLVRDAYRGSSVLYLDLLDAELEARLRQRPQDLQAIIAGGEQYFETVIIDEIQRVPRLLDVVHQELNNGKRQFILTGSSARKLRRGAANLLAGRAFMLELHPLTAEELGDTFELDQVLNYGALPEVSQLAEPNDRNRFLKAYARTYLREEVWAEHVIRKLEPFEYFLEVSAQMNGEVLNYSKIARDVGVDSKTVRAYFQILEDTLIGIFIPAYDRSVRKRQRSSPKFYFFDLGVKRGLDKSVGSLLSPRTYSYGKAFEHFVILEIYRRNSYLEKDFKLSYLRTQDGSEIDLIVERPGRPSVLVEIKSTGRIDETAIKHLESFRANFKPCETLVLSLDQRALKFKNTLAVYWKEGLRRLGL